MLRRVLYRDTSGERLIRSDSDADRCKCPADWPFTSCVLLRAEEVLERRRAAHARRGCKLSFV